MPSKKSGKQKLRDSNEKERKTVGEREQTHQAKMELRMYCLHPDCRAINFYTTGDDLEHSFDHLSLDDQELLAFGKCKDCNKFLDNTIASSVHSWRTNHEVVIVADDGPIDLTPELMAAGLRQHNMNEMRQMIAVEVDMDQMQKTSDMPAMTPQIPPQFGKALSHRAEPVQCGSKNSEEPTQPVVKEDQNVSSSSQLITRKERPLVMTVEMADACERYVHLLNTGHVLSKGTKPRNTCSTSGQKKITDATSLLGGLQPHSFSGGATPQLLRQRGMLPTPPSGSQTSAAPNNEPVSMFNSVKC